MNESLQLRGADTRIQERLQLLGKLLNEDQLAILADSVSNVLDRVIVGKLLTDGEFDILRRFPDMYAGESAARIDIRLTELGLAEAIRRVLVPRLRGLIIRGQGGRASAALITDAVFRSVISKEARMGTDALRCNSCGYNFRDVDMSAARRNIVQRFGLALSSSMRSERVSDNVKGTAFTALHIDHVIPRAGWGPTDAANLQVLCELCNQGKAIFENGYETLSVLAAAAYSLNTSVAYRPNQTIFYATLAIGRQTCSLCGDGSDRRELTVVPDDLWFTPWTSRVVCYDCF